MMRNKGTYDALITAMDPKSPYDQLTLALFAVALEQASVRDILKAYTRTVLAIAVEDKAFASTWMDALGESLTDMEPRKVRELTSRIRTLAARSAAEEVKDDM